MEWHLMHMNFNGSAFHVESLRHFIFSDSPKNGSEYYHGRYRSLLRATVEPACAARAAISKFFNTYQIHSRFWQFYCVDFSLSTKGYHKFGFLSSGFSFFPLLIKYNFLGYRSRFQFLQQRPQLTNSLFRIVQFNKDCVEVLETSFSCQVRCHI